MNKIDTDSYKIVYNSKLSDWLLYQNYSIADFKKNYYQQHYFRLLCDKNDDLLGHRIEPSIFLINREFSTYQLRDLEYLIQLSWADWIRIFDDSLTYSETFTRNWQEMKWNQASTTNPIDDPSQYQSSSYSRRSINWINPGLVSFYWPRSH